MKELPMFTYNLWVDCLQWCSGKFALVGTLAWHYDHIPYGYPRGGGGGGS